MKTDPREGDSYTDRLFHWLKHQENLPIDYIKTIKPKVYQVKVDGHTYLLKGYRRASVLKQQIDFFKHWNQASHMAACPIPFPDASFTKSKLGCEWGLFEWLEGEHADFKSHYDRQQACYLLKQFHRTTKGISILSIPRDPLYIKWERRLEDFENTQNVFNHFRKQTIFREIRAAMHQKLEGFSEYDWGEIEEKAWLEHEWLHGDLAHHNFIMNPSQGIRFIDFDLFHNGPKLYDQIQLAQRFLPYLENHRAALINYFPHTEDQEIWLKGVLVPADILREWLYGYRKCRSGEASMTLHMSKLEKAWENRKMFVRYAENMLR